MSIDVDRLAAEMVRGAQLLIDRATAPLMAANETLRATCEALATRLAEVEARAPVPGPAGRDGVDGKDGSPGPTGERGVDGAPGERGADGLPGAPGPQGPAGERGASGERGADGAPGERGADGINGKDGADGQRGLDGAPGRLPLVKAWADQVHYEGDCVTLRGATWQAQRDTGQAPPHADWTCIAAAGEHGRSLAVRGTYDAGELYRGLDVVALNGGSFVALSDDPGECPGPGWQLLTAPGKRGQRGEDGPRGLPGEQGKQGIPGPAPVALTVTHDGVLTLTMETGDELTADFYPVLSRVAK